MNDVFEGILGGSAASNIREVISDFDKHFKSGGEVEYDQLTLDDFDSGEFEYTYKYLSDITLQFIKPYEWMIWYKGSNVTEKTYRYAFECLTNTSLIQIHKFVQNCTATNSTFTVVTETSLIIEHIGRTDYKKKLLQPKAKSYNYDTKQVPKKTQCSHCDDSGKLLVHNVEQSMWNGIPINIHQQQEILCTCNS